MAEGDIFSHGAFTAGREPEEPEPGTGEGATFGDVGRRLGSSALGVGGQAASLTQYTLEQFGMPNAAKIAKAASQFVHIGSDVLEEGVTPGGQRAHGLEGFKEAPISTFFMEGAGVAPTVAIFSLVPGGFISEGLVGGTLMAGQVVDQAIAKSNNLSDAQKQDRIPYYKHLRVDQGLSEDQAVAEYHRALVPYKTLATAALIGTATFGAGARLLKNGAIIGTGGRIKSAVEGGTEGVIAGGAGAVTADVAQQQAEGVEKSPTGEAGPIDWSQALSEGLKGALTPGVLGTAGGAFHGRKAPPKGAVEAEPEVTIPSEAIQPPAPPPESQNMLPPSGLQHQLDLRQPTVAPSVQAPAGQQDIFAAPPTGHSGRITDAEGNTVGQAPPPPGPPANPPITPAPPAPVAPQPPPTVHSGAVTDAEGQTVGQAPIPAVPTGDLPLKPPAYVPTSEAPAGQGDLFEPKVTIPSEAMATPPDDTGGAAPTAPVTPGPSLEDIHAAATKPAAPAGAVDTSTTAPPPAPAAPAPKKTRGKKAAPTVQVVPDKGPDADQSAALTGKTLDQIHAEATAPAAPVSAEAVPTVETPAPKSEIPATAPTADEKQGAPDETVTASQPPKGAGTGTPGKPPDEREPVGTTAYTKPGSKGKAKKTGTGKPAAVTPEISAALAPEPVAAKPPPPPDVQPEPAAPPPPEAAPAPPAPAAAPPAPGPSLADIHAQATGQQPPPAPPVQPRAEPPVASPVAPAGPSLADIHAAATRPAEPAPAPAAPPAPPAPAAAPAGPSLADIYKASGAADPALAGQDVATTEAAPPEEPMAPVAGRRVLPGGSAAPAFDAARTAEVKQASDKALAAGAQGEKRKRYSGKDVTDTERKAGQREAADAVTHAANTGVKEHPIYTRIDELAKQQHQGRSAGNIARSKTIKNLVRQIRDLPDHQRPPVDVGGARRVEEGGTTPSGIPVTKEVRASMDRSKAGRKARDEAKAAAVRAADAAEAARQDPANKPLTAEARGHVERAARDPNRTQGERDSAATILKKDDAKIALQKQGGKYVAPEFVATAKAAGKAAREETPPPKEGASKAEWDAWVSKVLDPETKHIEKGTYGTGRTGVEHEGELNVDEDVLRPGEGIHELGHDEGFHEGDRPTHEQAVGNEPMVDDPKGLTRQLMAMQMQDAREMTNQRTLEGLPVKASKKRASMGRLLSDDQLKAIRDDPTETLAKRQYASQEYARSTGTKPKRITKPRAAKAEAVTPGIKPETAAARLVDGLWKPTVSGKILEGRPAYTIYKDALHAAQAEARHRLEPTEAVRPPGVKADMTATRVETMRSGQAELIRDRTKDIADHRAQIALTQKETSGHQSLLNRRALKAEAAQAGMKVADFRKSLEAKIAAGKDEIATRHSAIETAQAAIEKHRARIKELTPFLEHPETLRRRAEEVESERGGQTDASGGARLGGGKTLGQIFEEGRAKDETVERITAKAAGDASQEAERLREARRAEMVKNNPALKDFMHPGHPYYDNPPFTRAENDQLAKSSLFGEGASKGGTSDILQRTVKAFDQDKSEKAPAAPPKKPEPARVQAIQEKYREERARSDYLDRKTAELKEIIADRYIPKARRDEAQAALDKISEIDRDWSAAKEAQQIASQKKGGDWMSEKSDRTARERERAQRRELEKVWAKRIEDEQKAKQAARDKATAELDAEIAEYDRKRQAKIDAAGGPENFVTMTKAKRLLKEVGWEPDAVNGMVRHADVEELHRLIDYAEATLRKRAEREAAEAAATGKVTVDMRGKKITLATDPGRATNVRDALNDPDVINRIHGLTRTGEISTAVMKKVQALAGDVPVHYVSRAELTRLMRADFSAPKDGVPAGYYDHVTHQILINSDLYHPEEIAHTIFHEAVHAATARMIDDNPGFKAQIRAIMDEGAYVNSLHMFEDNRYAFTNEKEFVAEAFSNKTFREHLAHLDISPRMMKGLGLEGWRKTTGFKAQLRNLWDAFKMALSHAFGEPKSASFLEATLSVTDRIMKAQEKTSVPVEDLSRRTVKTIADSANPEKAAGDYMKLSDAMHDAGEKLSHFAPGSKAREIGYAFRAADQLRQGYEHLFGARDESNPFRNLTESIEKAGVKAHNYHLEGNELSRRFYELAKAKDHIAIQFARLAEAATIANVHLDRANGHLSAGDLHDAQARAMLPKLKAEFDAMVKEAPETKQLWADAVDYFQKTHDAMAKDLIDNHVGLIADAHTAVGGAAGLKQRLFDGKATADDMKLFSDAQANSFAQMREIHKMDGAYFPLMRRGDFAVKATMKVDPGKGKLIGANVVQFANEADAHAYAAKSPLKVNRTSEVWVDRNNPEQRVGKNDPNAVQAYRLEVQHEHVSFHEKQHEAVQAQADLRDDPLVANVSDIMRRQNNKNFDISLSSPQVQAILRSIDQMSLPQARRDEMKRTWIDISQRMMTGNRIETRRIPRRNVIGASRDMAKNISEYSLSSSAYRAKLEFAKPIFDALARMQKEAKDLEYSGDNEATLRRGEMIDEMTKRLHAGMADMNTKTSPFVQGLMTLSYQKSMGSPAHMLIHSTHPWMISAPYLAARHGAKAYGVLGQMYKDMGGTGAVKEGMKSFARQVGAGGTAKPKNWLDHFKAEFHGSDKADMIRMWEALAETGDIHPEAGMEVHRMDPSEGGVILAGLRRVDAMVREMSSTSEAMNRFAESGAAYRLERSKGASHDEAVRYAKDSLRNTQGLWSRTNAPRVFNKYTRPFLQFKQFPQLIYNLLAKSAYQAFKGDTPEIRAEARRQFAGVVATHALMAGALGLPTEPIRAVMMLGNAMGLPGMDWGEHETQLTQWLADKYGPQAADIIMHGATHALGPASIKGEHRLGLGNPVLSQDPRSSSEADLKSYAFDMFFGAPVGAAWDLAFKGPSEIMQGQTVKGLETMSPLKGLTDPIRAAAGYFGGKSSARGNQISPPLNAVQTAMQSIGFVPAAVAQANDATAALKHQQIRDQQEHTAIINGTLEGKFDGADIARWNYAHPDRKISYSTLKTALKENALPQALGQKMDKMRRPEIQDMMRTYNIPAP